MLWVVISFSLNIGKNGSFLERGKITQMWVFSSPFLSGIAEKGKARGLTGPHTHGEACRMASGVAPWDKLALVLFIEHGKTPHHELTK